MSTPKVYIHEFIDIIGPNRAKYMHHMTANWCRSPARSATSSATASGARSARPGAGPRSSTCGSSTAGTASPPTSSTSCRIRRCRTRRSRSGGHRGDVPPWRASTASSIPAPWTRPIDELVADERGGAFYAHEIIRCRRAMAGSSSTSSTTIGRPAAEAVGSGCSGLPGGDGGRHVSASRSGRSPTGRRGSVRAGMAPHRVHGQVAGARSSTRRPLPANADDRRAPRPPAHRPSTADRGSPPAHRGLGQRSHGAGAIGRIGRQRGHHRKARRHVCRDEALDTPTLTNRGRDHGHRTGKVERSRIDLDVVANAVVHGRCVPARDFPADDPRVQPRGLPRCQANSGRRPSRPRDPAATRPTDAGRRRRRSWRRRPSHRRPRGPSPRRSSGRR